MKEDVILILGSKTDGQNANVVLKIWGTLGITYRVAIASCHRHGGGEFEKFINGLEKNIIVFIGGMSLAAPGLIETLNKGAKKIDILVFAIPTDKAARSAIENLPAGTAIITSGLNTISLTHSLKNNALAIAKLIAMLKKEGVFTHLKRFYEIMNGEKPLTSEVKLNKNGLIPIKED